jgi:hypothetical protein
MAQQDILLPGIEHDRQAAEYWCGPACINIVLSYWDKQQPQATLWESIKTNTGSVDRPEDAPPPDDGSFKNQQCDKCNGGGYHCWYTTPEAMAKTISGLAPETVSATYQGSQDAIRRMADSVSATSPVAAVFTTLPSLHWVVAVGYQLDGTGASIVWNGKKLTALYVRDPALADPGVDITQLATIDGLERPLTGLLMAVECGPRTGLYPVVAKGVAATSNAIIVQIVEVTEYYATWLIEIFKRWARKLTRRRPPPPG